MPIWEGLPNEFGVASTEREHWSVSRACPWKPSFAPVSANRFVVEPTFRQGPVIVSVVRRLVIPISAEEGRRRVEFQLSSPSRIEAQQ